MSDAGRSDADFVIGLTFVLFLAADNVLVVPSATRAAAAFATCDLIPLWRWSIGRVAVVAVARAIASAWEGAADAGASAPTDAGDPIDGLGC